MFAIIIINYNSYEKTIDCINSIRETANVPYKIYLIDNASTNESATVLEKEYKDAADVRLILSDENLGYARGNNLCIKEAVKERSAAENRFCGTVGSVHIADRRRR